jgi:hypothetical protein
MLQITVPRRPVATYVVVRLNVLITFCVQAKVRKCSWVCNGSAFDAHGFRPPRFLLEVSSDSGPENSNPPGFNEITNFTSLGSGTIPGCLNGERLFRQKLHASVR